MPNIYIIEVYFEKANLKSSIEGKKNCSHNTQGEMNLNWDEDAYVHHALIWLKSDLRLKTYLKD